jgi:hypothetical protein
MIRFWDSKLTGAPPLLSWLFGGLGARKESGHVSVSASFGEAA